MIPYRETKYGFVYGAATVERVTSDEKKGWVVIRIGTPRREMQVRVTRTGRVRLWCGTTEVDLPSNKKRKKGA